MVIKSAGTGSLAYSEIASEFGSPKNNNIGAYRVSQTVGALSNLALDNSSNHAPLIPQSGQIRFSDFYGKRLNMVVDFYSGGTVYRQVGKSRYDANAVTVIGGFKKRPKSAAGTRVFIHVNKFIGSAKGGSTVCALRTGSFGSTCLLNVDVGGSGRILGAGGNGGKGADNENKGGGNGGNGTSGLGVNQTTTVKVFSGGIISAGFGGGGGGGGAYDTDKFDDELASGGGGGGGAGLPGGSGGPGGESWGSDGGGGGGGSTFSRGGGGGGGNADGEAKGGKGGNGGQNGSGAGGGGNGGGEKRSGGGSGGGNGYWLCSGGNSVSLLNSGSVRGGSTSAGGS